MSYSRALCIHSLKGLCAFFLSLSNEPIDERITATVSRADSSATPTDGLIISKSKMTTRNLLLLLFTIY